MIEEIKNIPNSNKDIKSFGITIGIILFILSGLLMYYDKEIYKAIAILASAFTGLGLILPLLLKPIYFVWMVFAAILGWIMTRVILSLVFYLIITPIGLITRIIGEDFLALKKKNLDSYWNHRDSSIELNQDYEKQF
tara:strand:+ start:179 stop:589 length:411 start_codon:yes stop_codon:yes gene_type:complete